MKNDFRIKLLFKNYYLVHFGKEKLISEKNLAKALLISDELFNKHLDEIKKHNFTVKKFESNRRNIYIRAMVDHKTNVIYYDDVVLQKMSVKTDINANVIRKMIVYHEICHILLKKYKLLKGLGFYSKRAVEEVICSFIAQVIAECDKSLLDIDLQIMKGQ